MWTTSFRPTPYGDLHLGHVWNAYLNWSLAVGVPGGAFLLIIDDLQWRYGNGWRSGFSPEHAAARYLEDLAWLGMEPDRVEWSRDKPGDRSHGVWRRSRQKWAVEKLLGRYPKQHGRNIMSGAMALGGGAALPPQTPRHPQGGMSSRQLATWVSPSQDLDRAMFHPFVTACCIADDIDFGVTAWCAGRDLIASWGWCLWAYHVLGTTPPAIDFHKCLKRTGRTGKISKTDPGSVTVRQLREAGYEPRSILDTLCELSLRSHEGGFETIAIPADVLTPESVSVLEFRDRDAEETAAGLFDEEDERVQEWKADIMDEAARQVREEVGLQDV